MKKIHIHGDDVISKIDRNIYGHFAEHIGGVYYDGIWVGEDSKVPNVNGLRLEIIEKMKKINAPVIRWPGGCFAETYDWRDGIGPRENRPTRINWWRNDDGRYEPNTVGTHEFMEFCRLCGAEAYFAANITSLTPLDIRDWMDYCNSPAGTTSYAKLREQNGSREPLGVKYWGVGNETWGGGGNMTAEMYAHEYRKYAVIMQNTDPKSELILSGANGDDWRWVRDVLDVTESSARLMAGMSLHYYCGSAGNPLSFTEEEWYRQLRQALYISRIIERNWGFVVGYGMENHARLVIDEWGCWHPGGSGPSSHMKEYGITPAPNNPSGVQNLFEQQSTMRDAMVTALNLNIFNNNAEKIKMANVAQLVNNLHCLFLAGGEHCITTPTYHIFDMMKWHQGADALRVSGDCGRMEIPENGRSYTLPEVSVSASMKDGYLTATVANLSLNTAEDVLLDAVGLEYTGEAEVYTLTSADPHDCNTYEEPEKVKLAEKSADDFDGKLTVPAFSTVTVRAKIK